MPHIAIVISGLSGRMNSGFELISRLRSEGHRVTCLCQPFTTETVARQGFDYLEIPEVNFKYSDAGEHKDENANLEPDADVGAISDRAENQDSWLQKAREHYTSRRTRYEKGKKQLGLAEYEKIWARLKPDYALIDVELHDLIFTAYADGIPITLFHTWFSDTPSEGLPPIRSSITPGEGLSGSAAGIAWARFVDWAKIRGRLYINRLKFVDYRRAVLKRYANDIGFPVRDLALSTLPPLYRFKKLPILLLAMKELDFPHRPDPNIHYVGPMVYENRQDLDPDSRDAQRLEDIYEYKRTTGNKLIYCAVGSLAKGDVSFLKKVIQIVGKEKEWLLILSLGRNLSTELFSEVPENVHLFPWVPQLKVLSHTDACINHAGINSINECLHFAVPMLIYSLKYTDENGNAARMAYHGLALSGDKDQDDAETIHRKLRSVLTDSKYRENMAKFNGIYQAYRRRRLTPLIIRTKSG